MKNKTIKNLEKYFEMEKKHKKEEKLNLFKVLCWGAIAVPIINSFKK